MGGLSIGHLILILIIVLLVFGTRRFTSGARDLGRAVNEFKKGMHGEEEAAPRPALPAEPAQPQAEVHREDDRVAR